MELLNMIDTIQPLERQYFLRCYCENMDAVVDGLRAIGSECDIVGDRVGAGFIEGMIRALQAFASAHVPLTSPERGFFD